ncbi:hypothetical protein [Sinorhizobium meliloti]|uniref:hypothetical protein n=1 Tax=Rhizobium meliloti TaxID=382 RepID=UPI0004298E24|nr:hypothetical protein [Sinorhizobium meliloti]MQX19794.1 hypothetical protein [Sinorhizobium meliloti]RVG18556.1 hypothetical protein CN231_10350 [Sinorhizobium meliloti]RVP13391.1 hypothetical protein CN085_18525 [Sinorhizobium meliloti]UFX07391.1 hypothetical protein SmelRRI128_13055 [Sinorhizobium meliloti]
MTKAERLIQPANAYAYEAANDNHRSHVAPVMAKARAGKLFPSPEENLLAVRTINRMDAILSASESDPTYTRVEEGQYTRASAEDDGDYIGGPAIIEVAGRSAEKAIEDYYNGPMAMHRRAVARIPGKEIGRDEHGCPVYSPPIERAYCSTAQSGRFRFNEAGIIIGYRLNREYHGNHRDTWVKPNHPKHPDNRATPRDSKVRDRRSQQPGKTTATDIVTPANDNFDARSCVAWLKARLAPEHYEAVYDVTAGLGFGDIGRMAGFSSKQAEAVGRDRVVCGLRQVARLLADWDDTQQVHPKQPSKI